MIGGIFFAFSCKLTHSNIGIFIDKAPILVYNKTIKNGTPQEVMSYV